LISFAQNFEDVILNRVFINKKNGFFLDIGAQHPVIDSVSRHFILNGWNGILVEPVPAYATLLKEEYPHITVMQKYVGEMGKQEMYIIADTGLSTSDELLAQAYKNSGLNISNEICEGMTLDEIFEFIGEVDIDWMKIDAENSEVEILNSWKSENVKPTIVVLEVLDPLHKSQINNEVTELMKSKGYVEVYFDGLNKFFLSKNHGEMKIHFNLPPNIFDNFSISKFTTSGLAINEEKTLSNTLASEIAQTNKKLEAAQHALFNAVAELVEVKAELKGARIQSNTFFEAVSARENEIEQIWNSASWRVTKPLRWIWGILRRLKTIKSFMLIVISRIPGVLIEVNIKHPNIWNVVAKVTPLFLQDKLKKAIESKKINFEFDYTNHLDVLPSLREEFSKTDASAN
jgi:FkbM family methyltransferase